MFGLFQFRYQKKKLRFGRSVHGAFSISHKDYSLLIFFELYFLDFIFQHFALVIFLRIDHQLLELTCA